MVCIFPCLEAVMTGNEPVLLPAKGVKIVLARPGKSHGLGVFLVMVPDDEVLAARQLVENSLGGQDVGGSPEAEVAQYPDLVGGLDEGLPGGDQALIHLTYCGEGTMRIPDNIRMIEMVVGSKPERIILLM